MKSIDRIAIFGAGAMGAAYAGLFTDNSDMRVFFAARGDRFARLDGAIINVNGSDYKISVVHPDRVDRPFDLVLVTLKHHHLTEPALKDINALTGPDTLILSVMNGLESEKLIGHVCGHEKIVPAIAVGIDAVHQNNCFTFANPGKIIFGNDPALSNADDIDRLERIKMALARHRGINLQSSDIDQWMEMLNTLSPDGKTSMLQDMEAKRKTEVEIFGGAVEVMGKEDAIPTPVNSTFLNLIRVMESNQ
ncbi:2-dehydropantoate 2-reductase [Desulfobacter latus]|uniref:2-dehydropantoate 2-reductase n=1 Tax=Desulfobacter latus TaxID=2292 RepID=A0A850SQV6_9BACT|nr:2-dehydropantoate 2-reductase [Desulfobacter latus]